MCQRRGVLHRRLSVPGLDGSGQLSTQLLYGNSRKTTSTPYLIKIHDILENIQYSLDVALLCIFPPSFITELLNERAVYHDANHSTGSSSRSPLADNDKAALCSTGFR